MVRIKNEKIDINSSNEMNDLIILEDIILNECFLSNSYNVFMSKCSNKTLFIKILDIFKDIKFLEREALDILFSNGWTTFKIENEDEVKKIFNRAKEELNKL